MTLRVTYSVMFLLPGTGARPASALPLGGPALQTGGGRGARGSFVGVRVHPVRVPDKPAWKPGSSEASACQSGGDLQLVRFRLDPSHCFPTQTPPFGPLGWDSATSHTALLPGSRLPGPDAVGICGDPLLLSGRRDGGRRSAEDPATRSRSGGGASASTAPVAGHRGIGAPGPLACPRFLRWSRSALLPVDLWVLLPEP